MAQPSGAMISDCLNCTLPICDERDPDCAYTLRHGPVQWSQRRIDGIAPRRSLPVVIQPRLALRTPKRNRRDYWREYKRRRKVDPAIEITDEDIRRAVLELLLAI